MNKRRLTLGLLSVWIFSFLTGVSHVTASPSAEITVNSTADILADDGQCTLREAITAANNNTPSGISAGECPAGENGVDTIVVPAGAYTLFMVGTGDDSNATGDLDIRASMKIQGAGADKTYIQAGATVLYGIDRVFHINQDDIEVTFKELTIRFGRLTGDYALGAGVYIKADSIVNIDSCVISSNTNLTTHGNGGGIANLNDKSLNITNSAIFYNHATGSIGTLGGGIYHHAVEPENVLNIANSTIYSNFADSGAGVHAYYGRANLTHVSITGNAADFDLDEYGDGGGLVGNDQVTIKNSLIAGNTANVGENPDIRYAVKSQDYNLIGVLADEALFVPAANDQWGSASSPRDAQLGSFSYLSASHQLWPDSLVVDQVPAENCTTLSAGTNPLFSAGEAVDHDQRGNPRPNNDNCDIGAREYTSLTVSSALDSVQEDGLCTLREAVSTANSGVPSGNAPGECQLIPDALEIPAGTYTLSIVGAQEDENLTGDLDLQVDLTLNGAGAENTIIQAGQDAESAIDRVLDIHRSAQINALTIAHGSASSLPTDDGGGISHGGGGLFVLADSVIRDNIAEGQGGGLSISADYSYITNSAIIGNQSKTHVGGGLFLFGSHHTIANSTVSQNQAADDGGGVYLKGTDLYLTHVTITDNVSDSDNNGSGDGGGLFSENKLTLISTIIAGNDDIGGEKPDLAGTSALASRDYNLIGNIGSQSFTAQNNDIVGTNSSPVDPELDNLTGDVPYHLPSLDSPVIDTIPAASCTYTTHQENPYFSDGELVTHDQRGRPRPADSDMDGSAACEIGAIEVFEPPTSLYLPLVLME